jgi:uncharacterized protein YcbK (DUF882 family)
MPDDSIVRARTRRSFLKLGASALLGATLLPETVFAAARPARTLAFEHLHTGERLRVTYYKNGVYDRRALQQVNHLLRDFMTGDTHPIEPGLLDYLYRVQASLDRDAPFQIISGYRSPATNAYLRKTSSGVASKSLHMEGRAIDVRLPGVRIARLRETAADLRCGGVGFYPASQFVHLDTGKFRQW